MWLETTNLAELYGAPAMAWDDVSSRLDAGSNRDLSRLARRCAQIEAPSAHAVQAIEPYGATHWRF